MNALNVLPSLGALHFLRPWWLLGLLAVPLLAWAWRRGADRGAIWRANVDAHLLPRLLDTSALRANRVAPWLACVALALALLALAGPSWKRMEVPLWQTRAPLVIAVNLSNAMQANDLQPTRLLQMRAKLAALLRERVGGQVGLVAYADDAYTVAPLTDDAANIALFLDALSPDVMPVDGRRADRAIAWSEKLLQQAGAARGDILLLTDGANAAARKAAAAAARDGYRVSVLGLGTAAGAAYRDSEGGIAHTALDADALRTLASAGDGRYASVVTGDADLRALGVLDPQTDASIARQGEKSGLDLDGGYWLLLPLLLLVLLAFRRGTVLAALFVALCLPLAPARAAEATLWRRADQVDYQRMAQGDAAYRKGDYKAAAQAYAGIDGADAAYNAGNALAQSGDYAGAIAAYDRALQRQPGMADAIANRAAVEAAMKRKPPPQGNKRDPRTSKNGEQPNHGQGQSGDNRDGGGNGQQQTPPQGDNGQAPNGASPNNADQNQQRNNPDRNNPNRNNTQTSPGPGQQGAQPPPNAATPEDAAEQQAANQAQKQQMQRVLQQRQGQQPGDSAANAQAVQGKLDPAQREREQVNQAWLQRVPDDPGGLLRARFRLEYLRRNGVDQ